MNSSIQAQAFHFDIPQCIYNGETDTYELNEAAYMQIARVADLLAAISSFSHGSDKREEQLFNTLSFAGLLLEQFLISGQVE